MAIDEQELILKTEKECLSVHAPGTLPGTVNIKVLNLNCCDSMNCYVKHTHHLFYSLSPTPTEATNSDSRLL